MQGPITEADTTCDCMVGDGNEWLMGKFLCSEGGMVPLPHMPIGRPEHERA